MIELTPIGRRCIQFASPVAIARVFKKNDDPVGPTIVEFFDGSQLEVEESMRTITARIEESL